MIRRTVKRVLCGGHGVKYNCDDTHLCLVACCTSGGCASRDMQASDALSFLCWSDLLPATAEDVSGGGLLLCLVQFLERAGVGVG